MEKKKNVLLLAFVFAGLVALSLPAFADDGDDGADDSIFQKASDVIHGKYEVKTVPYKEIKVFQKMSDAIGQVRRD